MYERLQIWSRRRRTVFLVGLTLSSAATRFAVRLFTDGRRGDEIQHLECALRDCDHAVHDLAADGPDGPIAMVTDMVIAPTRRSTTG